MLRIIGIDPGLQRMGWGIIDIIGNNLKHVANNVIRTEPKMALSERLVFLEAELGKIIEHFHPRKAAIEQTFVNKDAVATLKLGQARAMALFAPASRGLMIEEYAPNTVKKTVVGKGHADKEQVQHMLKILLPAVELKNADSADALAIAITAAYHQRETFG
ncbi:MAG: crossover junction endodeoxyribonuclease RuvC [Pseudomonadota bacterium]